jgi:hypothetical protein
MLKINDEIFINAYYWRGELRGEFDEQIAATIIDDIVKKFKKENKNNFNEETLKKIERSFRNGVIVSTVGRLYR